MLSCKLKMLDSDTAAPCRLPLLPQLLCFPLVQIPDLFVVSLPSPSVLSSLPPPRCDVAQGKWVRCNVHMQKACHFPVFGLQEGALYRFRVRAVNKAGEGRPSMATEPILTADPLEHHRTMGKSVASGPQTCEEYKHITVESLIGDSFLNMFDQQKIQSREH